VATVKLLDSWRDGGFFTPYISITIFLESSASNGVEKRPSKTIVWVVA